MERKQLHTATSFDQLATRLADVPGAKSIVWIGRPIGRFRAIPTARSFDLHVDAEDILFQGSGDSFTCSLAVQVIHYRDNGELDVRQEPTLVTRQFTAAERQAVLRDGISLLNIAADFSMTKSNRSHGQNDAIVWDLDHTSQNRTSVMGQLIFALLLTQSANQDLLLTRARSRALAAIDRMPRYMCTETVDRSQFEPIETSKPQSCDQILANSANGITKR